MGGTRLDITSTVVLANGVRMPVLGLGTYKAVGHEAEAAVAEALRVGYRSIDTASFYGNEREIGAALAACGLPRESLFVTTKVWNDEQGFESTRRALAASLDRLGLTYVDLYLVHWPIRRLLEPTWRAMESLLADGLARAIGVSNFNERQLDVLLSIAETPPAVDQVELHPWLQQRSLREYAASAGIQVEAWAPAMRGRAAEEPVLCRLAAAHGVTPTQVALRWALQTGAVIIPKSVSPERIRQNADLFGFVLDDEAMAAIAAADRGHRFGPDPEEFSWGL